MQTPPKTQSTSSSKQSIHHPQPTTQNHNTSQSPQNKNTNVSQTSPNSSRNPNTKEEIKNSESSTNYPDKIHSNSPFRAHRNIQSMDSSPNQSGKSLRSPYEPSSQGKFLSMNNVTKDSMRSTISGDGVYKNSIYYATFTHGLPIVPLNIRNKNPDYKKVVGPGSYDPPNYFGKVGYSTIYKISPTYKFGNDQRKSYKSCSPGSTTYSPVYKHVQLKTPAYPLGKDHQDDFHTYMNHIRRSPGPIYYSRLPADIAHAENLKKVPSFHKGKKKERDRVKAPDFVQYPPPTAYDTRKGFVSENKGTTFGPNLTTKEIWNKNIEASLKKVPIPGPGSYIQPIDYTKEPVQFSFGKGAKIAKVEKNGVSPNVYKNDHVDELSVHRTANACSFGSAERSVDVRMWDSSYMK